MSDEEQTVIDEAPAENQDTDDGVEVLVDGAPSASSMPVATHIKAKQKWKQRVNEAEKKAADAAALEQENRLLRMQLEQQHSKPLSRDQFDSDEAYFEEREKRLLKKLQQEQKQQTPAQAVAEDDSDLDEYYAKAAKLKADDFDQAEDVVMSAFGQDSMRRIVRSFDNAPALIYALSKNPAKLTEFSRQLQSDPVAFVRDLTLFSTKVTTRPKSQPAPEPNALEGGADAAVGDPQKTLDKMREKLSSGGASMADILAFKREQRAKGVNLI